MKTYLFSLLLILIIKAGTAQTIAVTGKVSSNGKPVPFAFIADKQTQNATYTDSLGTFQLKADAASTLAVSCSGYKSTNVSVENKTNLNIVLSPGNALISTGSPTVQGMPAAEIIYDSQSQISDNSGQIIAKKTLEAMHGSRYLFNEWVHGYIIGQSNNIIQDPHSLYNYDKISGQLLLTGDGKSAIAVDNNQLKSFTLFDHSAQPHVFEIVPAVDTKHYVELLSPGRDYKIYKLVTTSFEKANYTTNGISSSGHNYDEYTDNDTHYVLKTGLTPKKFDLKKKSIKNAFADQADKLNKFITGEGDAEIDDNYLKRLGDYFNK